MTNDNTRQWAEFVQLIGEIGTGLLTTYAASGGLHTRPLQTLRVTRATLWFFTDVTSPKTDELRQDMHVSVAYADIARHRYAAASGVGRVYRDQVLARELWQIDQRGYYPAGPEDARLAVLEVSVERAEYWLAPGRSAYYVAALKAAVSGQPVNTIGENHKL